MSVSTEDRDISLVERLRFGGPNAAEVAGQAADEIESNRKRIAELEAALWYLIGDVEAAHRSHIPAPDDPPITDKEIANLLRAQSLLANYRPDEVPF